MFRKSVNLFAVLFIFLFSCTEGDTDKIDGTVTEIKSSDIDSYEKKMKILVRNVTFFSDVIDAEYKLFNVNGINGFKNERIFVPGGTSYDYQMILKIDKDKYNNWLKDDVPVSPNEVDLSWGYDLAAGDTSWSIHSQPKVFKRKDLPVQHSTITAVFMNEGILFKRIFVN